MVTHSVLTNTYYPDMLYQFFANFRKDSSHTDLISRVNSIDIVLNPDLVNAILKTKLKIVLKKKL